MYTKNEIVRIFSSIKTIEDYEKVMNAFVWLIGEGFVERTCFIRAASIISFRRVNKLGNNEN